MAIELIVLDTPTKSELPKEKFDGLLIPVDPKEGLETTLGQVHKTLAEQIRTFALRAEFKGKPKTTLAFDSSTGSRVLVTVLPKSKETFDLLEWARRSLKPFKEAHSKRVLVDLDRLGARSTTVVDALASALTTCEFELPKYHAKKAKKDKTAGLHLALTCRASEKENVQRVLDRATITADATNLVRRLAHMAGNDLTTSRYVALATQLAHDHGLKVDFLSIKRLTQMKAGAFLAVAQGSEDRGGGILKVIYEPKLKGARNIAFVGKGITFDTGGSNLKTGPHMFGMHGDMAGSAVALATTIVAAREKWPHRVVAYLAITDNLLSPRSYRPNDVVTSLKGLTIEVIDTDAEGRMVLADTLFLASSEKPDLVIDFATLTGSCVRAIGHNYSGGFTNRRRLFRSIIAAGRASGERVWPFPNDPDYARCLKSEVADIRQCRVTGGYDHIEASLFLRRFIAPGVPWLHVDLSAAHPEEGLAHVPGKLSGFGVRFAVHFVERFFS